MEGNILILNLETKTSEKIEFPIKKSRHVFCTFISLRMDLANLIYSSVVLFYSLRTGFE